ncbi:MAG: hypothetical protein NTW16_17330, partial [Bacteroidetes bacterium]|nr:hypothetical protein [Bacteroidota bacterium]
SITVAASANPVCVGTSVTFTATAVNGGTAPEYQWKVNGEDVTGATSTTYNFLPVTGDMITCTLSSNAICPTGNPATSNTITMTVSQILPVVVTIAASANPVCSGTSVAFTATPENGGSNPVYQWKVNGSKITGATNAVYSYIPTNNNIISCALTSNALCKINSTDVSDNLTMSVGSAQPVSVSIAASANNVCAGTSVTFTATPTNGGTTPVYQWKVNSVDVPGATNPTYSFIPSNGNTVTCVLTSSLTCATGNPATSNTVTMIVNPILPVSVSITASANPVVPLTSVTFTATIVNGGTSPTYQWRVNGVNVGATNATYTFTPVTSCNVDCVAGSNATCISGSPASSNIINEVVNFGVSCPGTPTVSYSGKTYNTVQIGTQCWIKENLDVGTIKNHTILSTNNGIIEKYCYNDLTSNCDVYGGLYEWNEMMQYVTAEGSQGICPSGWHIPTDAEFITLSTYLGGDISSGSKIKEAGTAHFTPTNTGATNESGFTAFPGGYLYGNSAFASLGSIGYFYTSTTSTQNTTWAIFRSVDYSTTSLGKGNNYKSTTTSVRCLKN